jgi:NitT/TauT family transport system substrate-binding protein/putative hydroxymethylpyrimidine transport system substrate-binding protein
VHSGLYAAQARGYFSDEGIDLEIREPSDTADGAKLLAAGRTDFAILDINDFGIARERDLDIVAIAAIVQRPLASVIAADRDEVRTPADLEGKTVGVTGVPSDDAVLDTILAEGGVDPDSVNRQVIGFNAVPLLAAGKIDAATAFWNAEGVELKRMGVPTREFRVDEFGAPRYPELIVAADRSVLDDPEFACHMYYGIQRSSAAVVNKPEASLNSLLEAVPEADPESQRAQLDALLRSDAFGDRPAGPHRWTGWAKEHGVISKGGRVGAGFAPSVDCAAFKAKR